MKGKTLFLIVSDYPFGIGEPFLDSELKYIAGKFNKIYFIITNPDINSKTEKKYFIPENSEIIILNNTPTLIQKLFIFNCLFSKYLYKELFIIKNKYQIPVNLHILKVVFYAMIRGNMFLKNLKKILEKLNIDKDNCLFYSYWCNEFAFSLARLKQSFPQVKTLTRTHGWDLYFERHSPAYLPFRTYIIKNSDAIFPISENGKQYIINKNKHIKFDNVKVSRLGTEEGCLNSLYKKNNVIKILSISYLVKLKRINLIIDSLSEIDSFSVEWTHIGEGKIFEDLKNYAFKKLSNKTNIKWDFKGNMTKSNIYKFLTENSFDAFINVSSTEGIPVSMMEAMSFGIPVIGTNVGGVTEIIENNINGFLLSPNPSTQEITNTIEKILLMPDIEYSTMRQNTYNTWNEKYNAEKNYNKFAEDLILLYK